MPSPINLKHPDRPVEVGFCSRTSKSSNTFIQGVVSSDNQSRLNELVDIGRVDYLYAISRESVDGMRFLPDHLRSQAIDMNFRWVSEDGGPRRITAGLNLPQTLCSLGVYLCMLNTGRNHSTRSHHST